MKDKTTRLFVNNLPWSTSDHDLLALFSEFGPVFWVWVLRREDGLSKGCGFVQLYSGEDAQAAIDALNGKKWKGRELMVNVARGRDAG